MSDKNESIAKNFTEWQLCLMDNILQFDVWGRKCEKYCEVPPWHDDGMPQEAC